MVIELEQVSCPSEDNVILKCPNTRAFIGQQEVGDGTGGDLFVASDCVSWIDASGSGFALVYPTIAIHGTCRDLAAFPHPCIYIMIDGKMPCVSRPAQTRTAGDDEGNEDDGNEEDDNSEADFTEVRFVPSADHGPSLEEMYAALSRGQSLNPDPNDDNSEDSEEGAEYDCEEEVEFVEDHHNGNGNDHQFDDNEEDNGGSHGNNMEN